MKIQGRRWAWLAGGAVATLGVYATLIEPRWLQLRRSRIHIRRLPRELEGLRIGLLTDLHAGGATPYSLVRRAVRLLMEERPDLVALTGDFAHDDEPDFRRVRAALRGLHAPLGVYAVPGNHDHVIGIDRWRAEFARDTRIRDLTNRAVIRQHNGRRICIAGVDDYSQGAPRLELPALAERDLTILLAHSPDQAERSRRRPDAVDLVVSGHTHGGQVRLPWFGAPLRAAEHDRLYDKGLRRRPWTQVYTSRGIGTVHLPVRFLARPEVAVLELTATPRRVRWLRRHG
jgi:uncharacterized protein